MLFYGCLRADVSYKGNRRRLHAGKFMVVSFTISICSSVGLLQGDFPETKVSKVKYQGT